MSSISNNEYYTTGEAARYLGISQSTVINYINQGLLEPDSVMPSKGTKVGRRKFKLETLDKFKETMKNKES